MRYFAKVATWLLTVLWWNLLLAFLKPQNNDVRKGDSNIVERRSRTTTDRSRGRYEMRRLGKDCSHTVTPPCFLTHRFNFDLMTSQNRQSPPILCGLLLPKKNTSSVKYIHLMLLLYFQKIKQLNYFLMGKSCCVWGAHVLFESVSRMDGVSRHSRIQRRWVFFPTGFKIGLKCLYCHLKCELG